MLAEVGAGGGHVSSEEGSSLFGAVVFGISASEGDPFGEFLNSGGESGRGVRSASGFGVSGAAHIQDNLNIFKNYHKNLFDFIEIF